MKFHRGPPIQRGAGLGSIFSGLWRALVPAAKGVAKTLGNMATSSTAKSAGKFIGKQVSKAAIDTALEALDGKPVGAAAKQRLKTATRNILHATQYNDDEYRPKKRPVARQGQVRKRRVRQPVVRVKRRRIQRREPLFDDFEDIEDDEYY